MQGCGYDKPVHGAPLCMLVASEVHLCCVQLQGAFEPIKVDESSLTGESLPVTKSHGSKVQHAHFACYPQTLVRSLCFVHGLCLGIC